MNAADEFSDYYAELIEGTYNCVDRVVLNAYFPLGQSGGGFRTWWRRLRGSDAELDDAHLREMAGTFARRLRAYCEKEKIVFIDAGAKERKHELADAHLPADPTFRGLFAVIAGMAPAPVWEVRHSPLGKIVELRHRPVWPYVKHYFFHLMDPHWGHVTVRMCGYPPFGAQVILNGHEWVERAARREQVPVVKRGNCFVEGSALMPIDRLAQSLRRAPVIGRIERLCEQWLYSACLCFALTREEQQRSGFRYQYSVFQLELSRNLVFWRGTQMDEIYQKLIDRTRSSLDLERLKTIFGFKHRPHQKTKRGRREPQVTVIVEQSDYDLTVFKVQWGHLTLKIYDKGGRVLRIEVVVHNAKALRCGKVLQKMPELLVQMEGMLVRFLNSVQAAHVSFLEEPAFDEWTEPTQRGHRRLAGVDLNKARNRAVVTAVVGLATKPDGFTVGELAQQVQDRTGKRQYTARNAAYDLAKLRGKDLVVKNDHGRRYRVDPKGLRGLCAYVVLRDKVIRPVLAGVVRRSGRPPKIVHPLDEHYVNLREEMNRTFATLGIAA
jgi:hypothetical protein